MTARPHPTNEPVVAPAAVLAFFVLALARSWSFWLLTPLLTTEMPVAAAALALVGGFGASLARWPRLLTKLAAAPCVAGICASPAQHGPDRGPNVPGRLAQPQPVFSMPYQRFNQVMESWSTVANITHTK